VVETHVHRDTVKESLSKQLAKEKEKMLVAYYLVRHIVHRVRKVFGVCFFEQHHALVANLFKYLLEEFSGKAPSVLADLLFKLNVKHELQVLERLKLFH